MRNRPHAITILAILFCLEPIGKMIFGSLLDNVSIYTLLEYQWYKLSFVDFLLTFALVPITGIILYLTKKWSYIFFILVEIFLVAFHVKSLSMEMLAEIRTINAIIFSLIHCAILGYFLISNIRVIFFNKSLRFWETDLRYQSDIDIDIYKDGDKIDCKIINISKSGAFISEIQNLQVGQKIQIKFSFERDFFNFNAEVVHESRIADNDGYGIRFINMTDINKYQIAFIIKMLARKSSKWYPLFYRKDRYV